MRERWDAGLARTALASAFALALLSSCGGGSTGNERDSGPAKTTLRVQASDPDGDTLHYQWRVTGGTVENRDARETVWTLPDSPGLHFAYVVVSDGKGGYAEMQYAVSSDVLDMPTPVRRPQSHTPPAVTEFAGSAGRLRFVAGDATDFRPLAAGGTAARRTVYLPELSVQVVHDASGDVVLGGLTDALGEIHLPKLRAGEAYTVRCSSAPGVPLSTCGSFTAGDVAAVRTIVPQPGATRNLRLYGHVDGADGGVCGTQNDYFGLQTGARVTLLDATGQPAGGAARVNRYGDYALDAAVAVDASLKARIECEGESVTLDVPAPGGAGYVATAPVELSHRFANRRPTVEKMVANGPDGNVRGRMIVTLPGSQSLGLPGAEQFLTYKGRDTKLSACLYYRALGAARDCDAQGNLVDPIDFEDWKRANKFAPYADGNAEVSANYINKMDLNLVRRMVATKVSDTQIAFYVCNHPGPDGTSQAEVDDVMFKALDGRNLVACVAMEWSPTGNANGGRPFTKFYTFGPDGALLTSVNLDGRGEKYMPGACVACHGGGQYNGRFAEQGNPSPYLGSAFLPFDTNNYYFATGLGEAKQSASIHALNQLVKATEAGADTPVSRLIDGWYAGGGTTLDKNYVPPAWRAADAQTATAGAARFYREVVGASCRTCHASMGDRFDWDAIVLTPARARAHVCGGTADVAINASMPNALVSRDRVAERIRADASLATLTASFLGCAEPLPDPVYPKR